MAPIRRASRHRSIARPLAASRPGPALRLERDRVRRCLDLTSARRPSTASTSSSSLDALIPWTGRRAGWEDGRRMAVDAFISYAQADRVWAEWIGWQLER